MALHNMLIIVATVVSAVVIKNVISFKLYHAPLHQDVLDPGFAPISFPYQKYERSNEIKDIVLQNEQAIGQSDNFQNAKKKKGKFTCPFPWGNFPDPDDCSYHYLCLNSNAKRKRCLTGELFDKVSLKCVEKSKAVCENEIITSSTAPDKRTSKTTKPSSSSVTTEKTTQKTGTFGSTKQATSTENIVSTSSAFETTSVPNIISTISTEGTPNDETTTSEVEEISTKEQYSTASDNSIEITDTDSITESSSSIETSKKTSEADITTTEEHETTLGKDSSPPVDETTQPLTSIATSVDETTVDNSATEDSTTIGTISTIGERVFECPENKGKFPHGSDCDYYYVCKNGKSTFRKCPSGMKFDRTLRQCYDEKQADCD